MSETEAVAKKQPEWQGATSQKFTTNRKYLKCPEPPA